MGDLLARHGCPAMNSVSFPSLPSIATRAGIEPSRLQFIMREFSEFLAAPGGVLPDSGIDLVRRIHQRFELQVGAVTQTVQVTGEAPLIETTQSSVSALVNSATINDLIMSAEYILSEGNMNVVLCERGIRTFETATRYTLDLSAVPILKSKTHLPVIVDPTHAIGLRKFVPQMSLAAFAAGADGLMIEVHDCPELAKSDGDQALTPEIFADLVPRLRAVAAAIGRKL